MSARARLAIDALSRAMPLFLRIAPNAIDCAIGCDSSNSVSAAGIATNQAHEMPRSYVSRNRSRRFCNASRAIRGINTVPTAFALSATGR